jgi:AmmeMemoRadiSam system protein A
MLKGEMRSKPSPGVAPETFAAASPASGRAVFLPPPQDEAFPPALARRAVEAFVLHREILEGPTDPASALLLGPAACFVCLKTVAGQLRGCIGTVEPARHALAEEIVHNAIGAATRDPRFAPVSADELKLLRYTVDVLERPEPAALEDLDPAQFGVIVEDNTGRRRGLLLPAIEGVESVLEQVRIATRKAGIASGEPYQLYRFRVRRFREAACAETFQTKEGLPDA